MISVLNCIVNMHDTWLVVVAGLLCIAGSWVTARLFLRASVTRGLQRISWLIMTALAAGAAIWCTHFIAMLGYTANVPTGFDPVLTVTSLFISVLGSTIGFVFAGSRFARFMPALGGSIVGLAIAAMHYTGMLAYRAQGIVSWDMPYLIAAIVLSVGLSALSLHLAMQPGAWASGWMAAMLALAILSLHFTGMTALRIEPMLVEGSFSNPDALQTLAIAIAAMSSVILAAGMVSYLIDDSVRAESMEGLRHLALNDILTGLPNRANFNDRFETEITQANERFYKLALIVIDLNLFKEINDQHGHVAGDEVLRILGRRFKDLLHEDEGEFAARTGGDEFFSIFRMGFNREISDLLARFEAALFRPIQLDGIEIVPGASFGVAIFPDDATDKDTLIRNADLAMYRAKADPLRNICFFEAGMDENVKVRRTLAGDLRQALGRNELSLDYQAQTVICTREIRGYEALLRWNHPRLGAIGPIEIISLAEETGLTPAISEWVLRAGCAEASKWEQPHKVAINLSAAQFFHADLPDTVMRILIETGLSPERLELEVTEATIFADRGRALHILRQVKSFGVSVALDDFGTGYSSLDTLSTFPFDKIKIDRSFFSSTPINPSTTAIVRAVLALGKTFGIAVLAEGIETYDQLFMLSAEGCQEAQGFLLGRPVSLSEIVSSRQLTLSADDKVVAVGDER